MSLKCEDDYIAFVKNSPASEIANHLLQDRKLCDEGGWPSILAHFLPGKNTDAAANIAEYLFSDLEGKHGIHIPLSVRRLHYDGILNGIKTYLANMSSKPEFNAVNELPKTDNRSQKTVSLQEISTAVEVLDQIHLLSKDVVTADTPFSTIISVLKTCLSDKEKIFDAHGTTPLNTFRQKFKKCYICQSLNVNPHPMYESLCHPCGAFNLTESHLTEPGNLGLSGKLALVTGGRINLGFHVALRLLRCGAEVIVTSRYPFDAESRYMAESDHQSWSERLHILGADFRASKDAFGVVAAVKRILEAQQSGKRRLDILVNNAAQTLTDRIKVEQQNIAQERKLAGSAVAGRLLHHSPSGYSARVRGAPSTQLGLESSSKLIDQDIESTNLAALSIQSDKDVLDQALEATALTIKESPKSSWTQQVQEIPYEDMVTAQSVNAFVPFILCRELLPLMGEVRASSSSSPPTSPEPSISKDEHNDSQSLPKAYILNVSSREGLFSRSRPDQDSSKAKGHHLHTNMTKAALNMITETLSEEAWRTRRVAMNTVDPGYMSADPEYAAQAGFEKCPIGWEDGTARVLWVIGMAEIKHVAVKGRFLKHFGAVDVVASR